MKLPILRRAGAWIDPALAVGMLLMLPVCAAPRAGVAAAVNLPIEEKVVLAEGSSVGPIAASLDGRLVVALEKASQQVRVHDAFVPDGSADPDPVTGLSCSAPEGLFVSGSNGSYLVHMPCSDGNVYQFAVTESDAALEAAAVSTVKALGGIDAATISDDRKTLYLAGGTADGLSTGVFSMSASTAGQTASSYASVTTTTFKRIVYDGDSDRVLGIDGSEILYVISEGAAVTYGVLCPNLIGEQVSSLDLLPLSSSLAVLLSSHTESVLLVSLATGGTNTCVAQDWGIADGSSPVSVALLSVDGVGAESTRYLYVHGKLANGGNLAVGAAPATASSTSTVLATGTVAGGLTSADALIGTSLARVYLGSAKGLSTVMAGPSLIVSGISDPVSYGSESSIELNLESDEDVASSDAWVSLQEPFESSSSGGTSVGELEAGTETPVELELSSLADDLGEGVTRLFIYVLDADGNLGWTSIRLLSPPDALEDFHLEFGDSKLFILFKKPEGDISDFEIVLTQETVFTSAAEFDEEPLSESEFTVGSVTYPGGDAGWPMSIGDGTGSGWTEEDGYLKYTLEPLYNDKTYYVAIRANIDGAEGEWSEVESEMPELVCGVICLSEESGGYCSCDTSTIGQPAPAGRWRFPVLAAVIPVGWILRCRRRISRRSA